MPTMIDGPGSMETSSHSPRASNRYGLVLRCTTRSRIRIFKNLPKGRRTHFFGHRYKRLGGASATGLLVSCRESAALKNYTKITAVGNMEASSHFPKAGSGHSWVLRSTTCPRMRILKNLPKGKRPLVSGHRYKQLAYFWQRINGSKNYNKITTCNRQRLYALGGLQVVKAKGNFYGGIQLTGTGSLCDR